MDRTRVARMGSDAKWGCNMVADKKDALAGLLALQEKMNRLFEETLLPDAPLPAEGAEWSPLADVYESADELVFRVDIPGVQREAVEVFFERNVISVKGSRRIEEDPSFQYHRVERPGGRFHLRFTLPAGWDASGIRASQSDGVLEIRVPRSPDALPRTIKIT